MTEPVTAVPGGARLRLHIQPRASRTELAGRHGGALKVRVQAPPVEGAANLALLRFLADRLDCPIRDLELVHGSTGRAKTVDVRGLTPDQVLARLGSGAF